MYSEQAVDKLVEKLSEAIAEIESLKQETLFLKESLNCIHAAVTAHAPDDLEDLIPRHLAHFAKCRCSNAIDTYEIVVDRVHSEQHWYQEAQRMRAVIKDFLGLDPYALKDKPPPEWEHE